MVATPAGEGELLQELINLKIEVGELKTEIKSKDEQLLMRERKIEEMRLKLEQNNGNAGKDNIIIASLIESVRLKDEEIKELKKALEVERRQKSVKHDEPSETNKFDPQEEIHEPDMIQQSVTHD